MKKIVGIGLIVLLLGIVGYRVITHGEEPAIKDIDAYQEEMGIPIEVEKVGETVRTGQPVVRIAKLNQVLIEIDINETEIAGIKNGQEVQVFVAAYPNKQFAGILEGLSLSADPLTRAFRAWVRVPNKELLLRPGMFAKVKMTITTKEGVLTISKDAIFEKDNKSLVYVVNSKQVAELREVQIGARSGNRVEILSGLIENELVVVLGQNKLTPGKKVNIVE